MFQTAENVIRQIEDRRHCLARLLKVQKEAVQDHETWSSDGRRLGGRDACLEIRSREVILQVKFPVNG